MDRKDRASAWTTDLDHSGAADAALLCAIGIQVGAAFLSALAWTGMAVPSL